MSKKSVCPPIASQEEIDEANNVEALFDLLYSVNKTPKLLDYLIVVARSLDVPVSQVPNKPFLMEEKFGTTKLSEAYKALKAHCESCK